MSRPTHCGPHRASDASARRNAERGAELADHVGGAVRVADDRLEQREVEREEHVLDHDDAEDQPALRIGEPAQLGQQLGDDRRRRDADRARDHECLTVPHPSANPNASPPPTFSAR